jgi:colanic acid/amylovoran biosynthesis glycosyltransferase
MKVAVFVDTFPLITETFILNQIAGLLERGIEVEIFATVPGEHRSMALFTKYGLESRTRYLSLKPKNYLVRGCVLLQKLAQNRNGRGAAVLLKAMNAFRYGRESLSLALPYATMPFLGDGKYDIVHCQFGKLGLKALKLMETGALQGKLVVSFRGGDATRFLKSHPGAYGPLFPRGDLFLTVSDSLKRRIIEEGCPEGKIRILHSGIDCGSFPFLPRALHPGERVRILSVGRLVGKKGFMPALEAMGLLQERGRDFEYAVIGEGPLRGALERRSAELSLEGRVSFPGWLPHEGVVARMSSSHILLAPSMTAPDGDMEGIPNVLKEAMAMGMPVVGTDHGGIPELVTDGRSGLLAREGDPVDLAGKIDTIIALHEEWPRMGREGRAAVELRFDNEQLTDQLIALYRAVLDRNDRLT